MKKWRYASGQLGLTLVSESFGTYLAFFYLEKLGLSAAFYALARTVYAFWDAINDPLFGHLSDRTKTRLGLAALLLFLPQSLIPAILVGALVGVGFAGVRVTGEVVMAKVIDLDAERTGTRREGAYYSLVGLLGRVSGALVGLAFALLGPLFGYVSGENPGPNPGLAFRFLISVVPGVAILLAYLLTAFFPHEVRE